jgi:hypothetical protein
MNDTPELPEKPSELPAIEFQSPGRFDVHNPLPDLPEAERWEPAPFTLNQTGELQAFHKTEEARRHALALLQQARRTLCLYSSDLEPWLYNHSSIQEACTRFLLAHPKNRLRILLRDASRALKEGHRLLILSRRLSSNFQIRKLHPDYPNEECAFLIADDCGLLLRPELDQYAGHVRYRDPAQVRLRQAQFDQAWNTSTLDPDLRSFLL